MDIGTTAGTLAFDIMRNDFHRPLIEGKANRDNIEEQITISLMSGAIPYKIDQKIVDLAIELIDDLISEYGVKQ